MRCGNFVMYFGKLNNTKLFFVFYFIFAYIFILYFRVFYDTQTNDLLLNATPGHRYSIEEIGSPAHHPHGFTTAVGSTAKI